MDVRRRPGAAAAKSRPAAAAAAAPAAAPGDLVLRPPNLRVVLAAMALFLAPFSYLAFVHYPLDADLRRSILICGAISLGGFFVVLRLIPVAARYLLRRGMFGKDINKKGLPMGEITVPESLGIVVGIVYLVIAILFQHFNFAAGWRRIRVEKGTTGRYAVGSATVRKDRLDQKHHSQVGGQVSTRPLRNSLAGTTPTRPGSYLIPTQYSTPSSSSKMPQYTSRDVGDPSQIKKNKQSMADLKLRRLTELNNRLREDLERERIPVSNAARSIIAYCNSTRDYMVPSVWGAVPRGEDPYAPQQSGGCCTVM